jgi:hypothetical protein
VNSSFVFEALKAVCIDLAFVCCCCGCCCCYIIIVLIVFVSNCDCFIQEIEPVSSMIFCIPGYFQTMSWF